MLNAASNLGISASALCSSEDEPVAQQKLPSLIVSANNKKEPTAWFLDHCNVVTFENEFVSRSSLGLDSNRQYDLFRPAIHTVELISDKLEQKKLLRHHSITSSPFIEFPDNQDLATWAHELAPKQLKTDSIVLKWSKYGYDGYGTLILDEPGSVPLDTVASFYEKAVAKNARIYAEVKIPFKMELAMVAAQDTFGNRIYYPLVETIQKSGVCEQVKALDHISAPILQDRAQRILDVLLTELKYVGVLAVEFFLTDDLKLYVNELAPRVHNSAHYSMDALSISQFEQHVLCTSGRRAQQWQLKYQHYGMINLLGTNHNTGPARSPELPHLKAGGVQLHWYQKTQCRPGRKMGHINVFAHEDKTFKQLWSDAMSIRDQWQNLTTG